MSSTIEPRSLKENIIKISIYHILEVITSDRASIMRDPVFLYIK